MVHIAFEKRLLVGALVGAALPLVLQGGVGAVIAAKVVAIGQVFFASLAAPLVAESGFSLSTCVTWAGMGACLAFIAGNFFEGDAVHKSTYAIILTAAIGTWIVASTISPQAALTTFFVITTFGYNLAQNAASMGYFAFPLTVPNTSWDQLPGYPDIFNQVQSIVATTRRGKATRLLFAGPPGTGKTSMAHAIAYHYGRKIIVVRPADLHALDPADRAYRIHLLFTKAALRSAVILLEEIEGVARHRDGMIHDQRSDEILSIMAQLENLNDHKSRVIVIATTNYPDDIDPSVIRPGRFDRTIRVDLPNEAQRRAIILHYRAQLNVTTASDYISAARMDGWSGADIAALIKTAAADPGGIRGHFLEIEQRIKSQTRAQSHIGFSHGGLDADLLGADGGHSKSRLTRLFKEIIQILGLSSASAVSDATS